MNMTHSSQKTQKNRDNGRITIQWENYKWRFVGMNTEHITSSLLCGYFCVSVWRTGFSSIYIYSLFVALSLLCHTNKRCFLFISHVFLSCRQLFFTWCILCVCVCVWLQIPVTLIVIFFSGWIVFIFFILTCVMLFCQKKCCIPLSMRYPVVNQSRGVIKIHKWYLFSLLLFFCFR